MTIIHRNETTKVSGRALYLNPIYSGQGLYLNQGGFLNNHESGESFVKNNSGLIKGGIEAGAKVASAIKDIKRASDEAKAESEKIKEIRNIRETLQENTNDKKALTEDQKRLFDDAIASVKDLKVGSGLKRF